MEAVCTQVLCWVLTGHCSLALPYLAVPLGRNEGDDANGPQRLLFTPGLGQAGPGLVTLNSQHVEKAALGRRAG